MEFFSKIKSYFTGKEASGEESAEGSGVPSSSSEGGFASKQQVEVSIPRQPILQSAGYSGAGGVQGLDWYKARLKKDIDGDLADEFLLEPSQRSRNEPASQSLKNEASHRQT